MDIHYFAAGHHATERYGVQALAKVSRDEYIAELCEANPNLDEYYGILKNKGYGTKKHMDGIKEYGISPFHRKSFGICKSY